MSSFRLRPRFEQVLDLSVEEARHHIAGRVQASGASVEIKSFPGYLCLRIPATERRYCSPRLNLSLEPEADGKTRVTGLYGPNANLWSSFLYAWLLVGSAGLFSGILGSCQLSLGMTPWGLWIFALMAAIAISLYILAQLGQKLAAQQTFHLHEIYEQAVGHGVKVE